MFEFLADERGIVLRRDAVASGIDDDVLRRLVRDGQIVRLRQGAYAIGEAWRQASAVDRHRLLAAAVRRQYGEDVALSHASACLEHGGPNWGSDLSSVHLTSLHGTGERRAARVVHHRGICRVGDVTRDESGWITAPTRTALDTASILDDDPAVAVLDWYVNAGLTSVAELEEGLAMKHHWPDTLRLLNAVGLVDPQAESVGETRTRLLFRRQGLPRPLSQFEIYHPNGRLAGRVDFAWPEHKVMLEFDGLEKLLRFRRPGETIEEAVIREKRREDLLRELTGWLMIRLVWADLDCERATAGRIRRAFAHAA